MDGVRERTETAVLGGEGESSQKIRRRARDRINPFGTKNYFKDDAQERNIFLFLRQTI